MAGHNWSRTSCGMTSGVILWERRSHTFLNGWDAVGLKFWDPQSRIPNLVSISLTSVKQLDSLVGFQYNIILLFIWIRCSIVT